MKSSHYRNATPPLSRSSSTGPCQRTGQLSPNLSQTPAISTDMSADFARQRSNSPDVSIDWSRYRPLSPDLSIGRRSRSPGKPRSLMESLLVAKMEALTTGRLVRTDSMDSCSSFGSMSSLPSDVCRCDDCLLGIVDFYMTSPVEISRGYKKVSSYIF